MWAKHSFNGIAFALAFSPFAANAADELFVCRDDQNPRAVAYLTINTAQKKVVIESGDYPVRCIATFRNGAYATIFSAPPGETCFYTLTIGREPPVHQRVSVDGNTIYFGGVNENASVEENLNMETGLYDSGNGVSLCQRPHA